MEDQGTLAYHNPVPERDGGASPRRTAGQVGSSPPLLSPPPEMPSPTATAAGPAALASVEDDESAAPAAVVAAPVEAVIPATEPRGWPFVAAALLVALLLAWWLTSRTSEQFAPALAADAGLSRTAADAGPEQVDAGSTAGGAIDAAVAPGEDVQPTPDAAPAAVPVRKPPRRKPKPAAARPPKPALAPKPAPAKDAGATQLAPRPAPQPAAQPPPKRVLQPKLFDE